METLVSDVIDELLALSEAQGCRFPPDFKKKTIEKFVSSTGDNIMWQDFSLGRPMEVETYLGSPIRVSEETGVKVPHIRTLYALLHNINQSNRGKGPRDARGPSSDSPNGTPSPHPRMSTQGPGRPMSSGVHGMNGNGMPPPRGGRPRGPSQMGPRRGPPVSMNGGPPNGYGRPMGGGGSRAASRRGSMDDNDLGEFSHLVLYDDIPEGGEADYGGRSHDMAVKERELQLRQQELAIREQEMRMRQGGPRPGPRRGPPPPPSMRGGMYDEDDDDDYYDPTPTAGVPMADDNFDMMSVTSKKNRKMPSGNPAQFRRNPETDPMPSRGSRFRPSFGRNRSSQIANSGAPSLHENILEDALIGYSSNRYASVDRAMMHAESRANSLTASRLDEMQYNGGGPPMGPMGPNGVNGAYQRRISQSTGNPYSPSIRGGGPGRPSPPNGYPGPQMTNGGAPGGRPSPPNGMRQPAPRFPPGQGNAVAPQPVEQHAGVSAPQSKTQNSRSLTGSVSASAGSGDSTNLDSEPSAHSSQSSLGPRPPIGVR